jgi:hypothetical protein
VPRISALEDDSFLANAAVSAIQREGPQACVQLHGPVFAEDNCDGPSIGAQFLKFVPELSRNVEFAQVFALRSNQ